ncbi:hypothetical protein NT04LS_2305 [Listeria seeligeri FSL S4-171]|uniref:Uncharacterized protein n=1 Tax=Listeria seeligeri FSL N1-067 TaxID=702453 RepID=E3ZS53_LISSE|nr:hypothetical protein NT03LS_2336 [Listeria seeligeri FSL N1-067]EFS02634.1 hypothetical protein NT04LS_2305 [Listeria seeligeri FSL S4-171]
MSGFRAVWSIILAIFISKNSFIIGFDFIIAYSRTFVN